MGMEQNTTKVNSDKTKTFFIWCTWEGKGMEQRRIRIPDNLFEDTTTIAIPGGRTRGDIA